MHCLRCSKIDNFQCEGDNFIDTICIWSNKNKSIKSLVKTSYRTAHQKALHIVGCSLLFSILLLMSAAGSIAGCVVDKKTPSHEPAWREELIQVLSASDHINRPPVTKLPTGYCTAMNCLPVNCIILHQKFSFWGPGMGSNFFRSKKVEVNQNQSL